MTEIIFKNHKIIIGRNQEENDLIIDNASPDDYWLHLSNFPSPHVIIHNPQKKRIHHKIIKQAAYQLKIHSKYKNIPNIGIDITKIKNLQKTNKPGMVIVNDIIKNIKI
jgi:predicted ribosome quality control (RQC) complex YloA/Tae2 family protein